MAEMAIDGNIESCAHTDTGFSFWAVEFGTAGPVKSVKIKSRTDCCFERQTNFTVTVANNRDDVMNDAGTDCGSYFGLAIANEPFSITINCTNTIFGKFLKVKHESTEMMTLCVHLNLNVNVKSKTFCAQLHELQ
ncbi:fucolectin-3-like [Ruditapes philippinarum]|uniref:fucolectin-3-like n=1 Tax=Ruditapes philippinarum TaxID=129788 RepID=UPI00295B5095|nr:fucolectin-3-like [Ruditapes philippinarum]